MINGALPKLWVPFWGVSITRIVYLKVDIGVPLFWETAKSDSKSPTACDHLLAGSVGPYVPHVSESAHLSWAAVKELTLSYHVMSILHIISEVSLLR